MKAQNFVLWIFVSGFSTIGAADSTSWDHFFLREEVCRNRQITGDTEYWFNVCRSEGRFTFGDWKILKSDSMHGTILKEITFAVEVRQPKGVITCSGTIHNNWRRGEVTGYSATYVKTVSCR